jgi:hypothetical protein
MKLSVLPSALIGLKGLYEESLLNEDLAKRLAKLLELGGDFPNVFFGSVTDQIEIF